MVPGANHALSVAGIEAAAPLLAAASVLLLQLEVRMEVVQRAAEAIQPRFEAIVDQFADRLNEFVESAGEALHRGISEVLDQALAERNQQQADAGPLRETLERQQQRLTTLAQAFVGLRAQLWQREEEPAAGTEPAPEAGV